MVYSFQKNYVETISLFAYIAIFFISIYAFKANSRTTLIVCVTLALFTSICAWASNWRRRRMITDTPTSRIASAAQGYVELIGRGQPLDDNPLFSHLTFVPCLWHRWLIERRSGKNKAVVDRGESDKCFILDDGSGRCIVDVYGAEILTKHKHQWRDGFLYFTEWTLLIGDPIYAIGEFRTVNNASTELNVRRDMGELLNSWKKDRDMLLKRFDLDNDGEISEKEWELARREARREVDRMHQDIRRNSSDMHILGRPNNARNRYFILSNIDENRLARRYLLLSFLHIVVFLAALGAFYWILNPMKYPG